MYDIGSAISNKKEPFKLAIIIKIQREEAYDVTESFIQKAHF